MRQFCQTLSRSVMFFGPSEVKSQYFSTSVSREWYSRVNPRSFVFPSRRLFMPLITVEVLVLTVNVIGVSSVGVIGVAEGCKS